MCIPTTTPTQPAASRIYPAVRGSYRWLRKPDADGMGRLRINGVEYAVGFADGRRLAWVCRAADGAAGERGEVVLYSLDLAAGTCTCKDFTDRQREDGLCKHTKAVRAALRELVGCTHCIHSRKDRPCHLRECVSF